MSDDPNSVGSTREAYVPISQDELSWLLHTYSVRSTARFALLELVDQRRDRVTLQKENAELRGELDLLTKVGNDEDRLKDMLEIIEEQRQNPDSNSYTLSGFSPNGLDQVEAFVTSFWRLCDIPEKEREDREDEAPLKPWKPTDTEAFAERLASVEDRLTATVSHVVTANKSIGALSNRIAYAEDTLQHHASLIAGLGRQAVDEAAQPGFPDPAPAEELVLERGSIVRVRAGAKTTGVGTLSDNRNWEVVGVRSAVGDPSTVQLGYLPWDADREIGRPLYWIRADDVVGIAE